LQLGSVFTKLLSKREWALRWQFSLPSCESGGNCCGENGTTEFSTLRDHCQVVEILHAAVRLTKHHHRMIFLSDDSVDRMHPQSWRLEVIKQSGTSRDRIDADKFALTP
jgi:hypothetical protein